MSHAVGRPGAELAAVSGQPLDHMLAVNLASCMVEDMHAHGAGGQVMADRINTQAVSPYAANARTNDAATQKPTTASGGTHHRSSSTNPVSATATSLPPVTALVQIGS